MRNILFSEAIRDAIRNEMLNDPRVFCIGEDIGRVDGSFGATAGLYKEFGGGTCSRHSDFGTSLSLGSPPAQR